MSEESTVRLLVVSDASAPELAVLSKLDPRVRVVAIGRKEQDFSSLSEKDWSSINVLLNCGVGKLAATRDDIKALWPRLSGLTWMHSASAGLEHLLFPDLVEGPVVLTNAKGVYSHSLAEYVLTACNWFAKDLPRLRRSQIEGRWDPFEVEELRGKTLGIIGFGDIGQATARLARAFKMKVIALRRSTKLTEAEAAEGVVDKLYSPDQLEELMSLSDYVAMATPHTPQTDKMVGKKALAAMRPHGVFINVGRGKCVDEVALVEALQAGSIRGAALDVFAVEPLPSESPLWSLDNALISPHCADRTKEFQVESLEFFVANMENFLSKGPESLKNVCDKKAGY